MLTPTLFDPNGFRVQAIVAAPPMKSTWMPGQATPGYLPGPVPAGEWIVQIDTHMIMPGEPCRYQLDIWATDTPVHTSAVSTTAHPASKPQPRG